MLKGVGGKGMKIGGLARILALACLLVHALTMVGQANTVFSVSYNNAIPVEQSGTVLFDPGTMVPASVAPGDPQLPWQVAYLDGNGTIGTGPFSLVILEADTLHLASPLAAHQPDVRTSVDAAAPIPASANPAIYNSDSWYPSEPVEQLDRGHVSGAPIETVAWCPFRYNAVRNLLVVVRRALIESNDAPEPSPGSNATDTLAALSKLDNVILNGDRRPANDSPQLGPSVNGAPSWTMPSDPPIGVSYVVITSAALSESLTPLVEWKARRGINAGLATIEAIEANYPAVDGAASIREYLKSAYAAGLTWVVLAGDETILPIRLAYAGYTQGPTDPADLQVCDLYFAELDGNWDADGDGIYGEYFGDAAELTSELYVGRLPLNTAAEATTIVDKIIAYESGPSDPSYLTRALDVCADQMRDWSAGTGQNNLVAQEMPSGWQRDNSSMIEMPSGDSPSPNAPDGPTLPSLLSTGYGWVNYYVHGRADGMVVRSSGYLDYAQSWVWSSGTDGDGQGHLSTMTPAPYPGIHLSIGCDHGGFDMDSPPFAPGGQQSIAEALLFAPEGGAAAFIGQSRWGWVSTSYQMIESFYQYVANNPEANHIGMYHTLMKSGFPSYRDLVYGNNLYGDPEMPVWTSAPQTLTVGGPETFTSGLSTISVQVIDNNGPVFGARVTLTDGTSVWDLGTTDGSGIVTTDLNLPSVAEVVLTASTPSHTIAVDTVPQSITTDVGDDDPLPTSFAIGLSNYPNPFNPATNIQFYLEHAGSVELSVFDILGRHVETLVDEWLPVGWHTVPFGTSRASGIYLARLKRGASVETRKMVLVR